VLIAAAVLAAVTGVITVTVTAGARPASAAAHSSVPTTATVEQRTLSATVSQPGTLSYRARSDGSPYSVINQARGMYTELPAPGRVITQGHALYRVNDRPVVLLYGSTPAYRTLSSGARGPDVAELNADLVARGYAARARLDPSSALFGSATVMAVKKLQSALGVTRSGRLALGQAVFEPAALRVTSVPAQFGGRSQPGQLVLAGTSTIRQVQVALDASQQTEVAVGDKVSITLPNNVVTPGVVSSVAKVASCPASSGSGPSSSSAAPGTDACSSSGSGSATPIITVGVTPSDPRATGTWDQAPVQVGITTDRVPRALTVPVTALLARAQGGYAVEVLDAGAVTRNHLVSVSLGLFDDADGLVQVTGSGLVAGERVVVAGT
jgi:peptidoglycan hydrolase-like protein with peptidoglycan-binding domain